MRLARATVVVLTCGGREALAPCLESLLALRDPGAGVDLVVVDQASRDDTGGWLAARYPSVRVLAPGRNTGCAGGRNLGAREARTPVVAFLDDDATVEPEWLAALVDALDPAGGRPFAGSLILDAAGERIEFAGPLASLVGHSWQARRGAPRRQAPTEARRVLFAPGGAMAADRARFLALGGFDERMSIYFEDLDLGWRAATGGLATWFVPAAVMRHAVHGTMGAQGLARRIFLHERNALAALFKNAGPAWLARALPAALATALTRAAVHVPFPHDAFWPDPARPTPIPERFEVPAVGLASAFAVATFARELPQWQSARAAVQAARRVDDAAIRPLFEAPFAVHEIGSGYAEPAAEALRWCWAQPVPA